MISTLILVFIGTSYAATFSLFGSSPSAIVGERFELTCITTAQYLLWDRGISVQATIIGIHPNGSCAFSGSYVSDFIYKCHPSTYTYKLIIPGKLVTKDKNGTHWRCQQPFGGGNSNDFQLNLIYPDVQVVLYPSNKILAKRETIVIFKCITPIRESWQSTVFHDDVFGSVVQFVPVDGFCNITVTNILYTAKCNLTSQEFIVELLAAFQWYDGHDFKCVVQYGSGSRTTDKYVQDSTNIEITEKYALNVNPGVVYFGSNISVILTCTITDANNEIQWWRDDELLYTIMRDGNNSPCTRFEAIKATFYLKCEPENRQFMLIIPPNAVSYGIGDTKWACSGINGSRSNNVKFIVTDLPSVSIPNAASCNHPESLMLNCTINANSLDFLKTAVWRHTYDGRIIRVLKGNVLAMSVVLQILFCSYQDIGEYACILTTDIPGVPTLNGTTRLSVSGPPIITAKSRKQSDILMSIFVQFHSEPFPDNPSWLFGNTTLTVGPKYSKETIASRITLTLHDQNVVVDGFISTLNIINYTDIDDGTYTFVVKNNVSVVEEKITTKNSDNSEICPIRESCSASLIVGVAAGCIVVTIALTILIQLVIKRLSLLRKGSTDQETSNDNYDQLGMRNLPNVYDAVRNTTDLQQI